MVNIKLVFVSVAVIALMGCATKTPDCNDSRTKDLVISIEGDSLKERFDNQLSMMKITAGVKGKKFSEDFGSIKLSVENVRITDHDEKIGKFTCSGNLVATVGTKRAEAPIDFTSELADGGEKQFVQTSVSPQNQRDLFDALETDL